MRILHIISTLGVGGAERQLVEMMLRMNRERYTQMVCFYTDMENFADRLHHAGIDTFFIDKYTRSRASFFLGLRRIVKESRPDVVHTWMASAHLWGRFAALSCGVRRLVASDRSIAPPASFLYRLYERMLAPFTVRLANSRAVAASLEHRYGLPESRTRIIYNAVALPGNHSSEARAEIRAELALPPTQRIILLIGRQTPEKNRAMFYRVARRLGTRMSDVTFVAIGRMLNPVAEKVLLDCCGASRFVRLLEQKEDVYRWLCAADVFCLTSDHEGLPNVVLEAMAAGLPIVCTDFDSAREVILDDRLGILVPRNDDCVMADAILTLLNNPRLRELLGSTAKLHVGEWFTWARLIEEMEKMYACDAFQRTLGVVVDDG